MLLGHFALGFAAKRLAPRTPLSLLLTAPFLLDLVFPLLVLLGWEQMRVLPGESGFLTLELVNMPYSHSLLAAVGWAVLMALPYFAWRRDGRGALILAVLVISHWVLDAVTHRPDVPVLLSGGPKVGLGLWYSLLGTMVIEGSLFAGCVWLYASTTRAADRSGRIALGSLVGTLVVMYLGFVFGPPPPSAESVAYLMLIGWVLPFWARWVERHRPETSGILRIQDPRLSEHKSSHSE
ncbi:hypothetical protein [Hyalangium versicolor]|uniref:hypothetical protein n=1 Tax=Hyalangium versicolor TaxID=2861190 RepID=UPI001CCEDB43|nr:hypothetical protein [Hyalangium versicolor]